MGLAACGADATPNIGTPQHPHHGCGACGVRLIQLQELSLWDAAGITDTGLAHIAGLTQLQKLDVSYTQITDAGLAQIVGTDSTPRAVARWHTSHGRRRAKTPAGVAELQGILRLLLMT